MSKTSYCKVCGVELTSENRYSNGKNKRRYCKSHWNEYKEKNRTKNYTLVLRRGRISTKLVFPTYALKNSFRVLRKIQIRFGRCHSSRSANFDQRIEDLIEKTREDGTIYRFYQDAECPECHSVIRYDSHGYKTCTSCGLIREGINLDYQQPNAEEMREIRRTHPARYNYDMLEDVPAEELYSCYDKYYARAYSRRLRK
jgi:Zn finger protein HypA/HybF involved in hydrogenase expression